MAKARKIIRNLHSMPLNLRFGSKKDPYHLQLARRGTSGDTVEIPGDLTEHLSFNQNVGRSFEVISAVEAKKITYDAPATQTMLEKGEFLGPLGQTLTTGGIQNTEDMSHPVGGIDAKGNIVRLKDVGPRRSQAVGTQDNPLPNEGEASMPPVEPPMPKFTGIEKAN